MSLFLVNLYVLAECREMIVVHSDEDFLEDISGKLKEVCRWMLCPSVDVSILENFVVHE